MSQVLIGSFYDELDLGVFPALKCTQCGAVSLPEGENAEGVCAHCGNPAPERITISGQGELQSYCVVPRGGSGGAPGAFGAIWLDEGPTYWARLEGVDLDRPWEGNLHLPLPVVAWQSGDRKSLVFRPEDCTILA